MAGPTVSVILERTLNDQDIEFLRDMVDSISAEVKCKDFWVNDTSKINGSFKVNPNDKKELRPFAWETGFLSDEDYKDLKVEFSEQFKFDLRDQVILIAMCNSDVDHMILGELALEVARNFKGAIDMGARLEYLTSDRFILNSNCLAQTEFSHILSPSHLRKWLHHPDFRMVK